MDMAISRVHISPLGKSQRLVSYISTKTFDMDPNANTRMSENTPLLIGPMNTRTPVQYQLHPTFDRPGPRIKIVTSLDDPTELWELPVTEHWGMPLEYVILVVQIIFYNLLSVLRTTWSQDSSFVVDAFLLKAKESWISYGLHASEKHRQQFLTSIVTGGSLAVAHQNFLAWLSLGSEVAANAAAHERARSALSMDTVPGAGDMYRDMLFYGEVLIDVLAKHTRPPVLANLAVQRFSERAQGLVSALETGVVGQDSFLEEVQTAFAASLPALNMISLEYEYESEMALPRNEDTVHAPSMMDALRRAPEEYDA